MSDFQASLQTLEEKWLSFYREEKQTAQVKNNIRAVKSMFYWLGVLFSGRKYSRPEERAIEELITSLIWYSVITKKPLRDRFTKFTGKKISPENMKRYVEIDKIIRSQTTHSGRKIFIPEAVRIYSAEIESLNEEERVALGNSYRKMRARKK